MAIVHEHPGMGQRSYLIENSEPTLSSCANDNASILPEWLDNDALGIDGKVLVKFASSCMVSRKQSEKQST